MSEQLNLFSSDTQKPELPDGDLDEKIRKIAQSGELRHSYPVRRVSEAAEDQGWGATTVADLPPARKMRRLPRGVVPLPRNANAERGRSTVRVFSDDLVPKPEERGEGPIRLDTEQIEINRKGLEKARGDQSNK